MAQTLTTTEGKTLLTSAGIPATLKQLINYAPKGFYDPVGWDDFLRKEELYSKQLPEGVRLIGADDPEIMEELLRIPSARQAMIDLQGLGLGHAGRLWEACTRCTTVEINEVRKKRDNLYSIIALYVNQLMMEKNAPLIQAFEEHERQLEIDQAVKIALEQKVRETATPTPSFVITDPTSPLSYLPFAVVVFVLGILLRKELLEL